MLDGKKKTAEKVVYEAFDLLKNDSKDPIKTLREALSQVSPQFEVKPRRVGGASYLVPTETRQARKVFLGFNWIVNAAKARSNKEFTTFGKKLAAELLAASAGEGEAVAKKKQVEKLAEANKAFAHFKW
jgi:small subunit ribosomal protein S7